ncbi:hypothetical protein BFX40_20350 [Mesorhizobium sp. SEMIA 3007]|nr:MULTISPECIES: hypothetical protein [Mesorhizobium]ODA94981.1 hypothetical protein BFX40_20350 [Mesorhizobium sp. SEMIA 3007]
MKDLHSKLSIINAFGPAVLAADNTPAAIDLQGFNAAEIELAIGVGGITFDATNKIEVKVTHSDDNASYVPVTDADMLGISGISGGIIKSLVAAHAAVETCRYGYKGGKRYLKILADFSGTHGTGTPLYASVIKSRGYNNPQPNAA